MLVTQFNVPFSNITKNSGHPLRTSSFIGLGANTQCGDRDFLNMGKFKDLTNKRFGRLIALNIEGKDPDNNFTWKCKCDCGNMIITSGHSLRLGRTKSCGCLQKEKVAESCFRHGYCTGKKTPEYNTWVSLIQRCVNPNSPSFYNYGGRGIKVDSNWVGENGFIHFLSDMGNRPKGMTIDRYPDKNGDYTKSNCRWATDPQQARNRNTNRIVDGFGRSQIIEDWAIELDIKRPLMDHYLKNGKTIEWISDFLKTANPRPSGWIKYFNYRKNKKIV